MTEHSDTIGNIPEVTAIIRVGTRSPSRPGSQHGVNWGDIGIRPLFIDRSLATVVPVAVLIRAAGKTLSLRRAFPIVAVFIFLASPSGITRRSWSIAILENVELIALNTVVAAVTEAFRDRHTTITSAVEVANFAGSIAKTSVGETLVGSVGKLGVSLVVVRTVTRDDT
jgi:hypothetical protein